MSMYFKDSEFACRCCGELPPNGINSVLLEKLDTLREMACEPVYVTCGYRCPKHNAEVGGVPNSQHTLGTACDIYCNNLSVDELAELAKVAGFDGIGRYYKQEFVHVDVRSNGCEPAVYQWTD